MKKSKLTNVNLKSSPAQVKLCDNPNCEHGDECCNSLNPCGQNDFSPVANVNSQQSGKRFVAALRVWRDFDDTYSTNAELMAVAVDSKEVKLLKDNGVTVTVPISLLSRHDQNYIHAFVEELPHASGQVVDKFFD